MGDDRRRRGGSGRRDDPTRAEGLFDGGLLDRFTSIDERLDRTGDALVDVAETNRAVANALSQLTGEQIETPTKNDRPLVADAVIEPQLADGVTEPGDYGGNTAEQTLTMPSSGTVTRITPVFPQGANQSIGIGVDGTDNENLVPFGPAGVNYLALDDKAPDFTLDYAVNKDEELTVRFINEREAASQSDIADLTAYASAIVVVTEVI